MAACLSSLRDQLQELAFFTTVTSGAAIFLHSAVGAVHQCSDSARPTGNRTRTVSVSPQDGPAMGQRGCTSNRSPVGCCLAACSADKNARYRLSCRPLTDWQATSASSVSTPAQSHVETFTEPRAARRLYLSVCCLGLGLNPKPMPCCCQHGPTGSTACSAVNQTTPHPIWQPLL